MASHAQSGDGVEPIPRARPDPRAAEGVRAHGPPRIVLLGASNLALGFPEMLALARTMWPGQLEVLAAHGLGRSYGITTSVLGRELPGIDACGLWHALDALPPRPTLAVLTDPGNDIAYEVPVERTVGWIRAAIERLARHRARIVLTLPPLASLERISAARFFVVRTLLFRARPLTLAGILGSARELDRRLRTVAGEHGVTVVTPAAAWYGWDRIHLRRRARRTVWHAALRHLAPDREGDPEARLSPDDRRKLAALRPEHEVRRGRVRSTRQPAVQLDDGSTLALY